MATRVASSKTVKELVFEWEGKDRTGKIVRGAQVRLVRDGIIVADDKIASLRRFKDDVKEVQDGYDCGITLERFSDIKLGDILEAYEMEEYRD